MVPEARAVIASNIRVLKYFHVTAKRCGLMSEWAYVRVGLCPGTLMSPIPYMQYLKVEKKTVNRIGQNLTKMDKTLYFHAHSISKV